MKHSESSIQQACVSAFRAKYPWAAKLLIHVKNEECGGAKAGGIHKAEGVVAGASDLLLLIPSVFQAGFCPYLCIEMKSEKGRIRDSQLSYREHVQAVGSYYVICRSLDQFMNLADEYMPGVPDNIKQSLRLAWSKDEQEAVKKARQELQNKVVGNNKPRRTKSVTAARNQLKSILSKA